MSREELENKLKERTEYLESNGIPYGEWGFDTEYVSLQNELNNLSNTVVNNDTRVNEGDLTISELNTELDDIDKLIKEKEDYFNSNAIPYGEWGFDSEYNDLIGRKANLERERDKKSRELDEVERQIKFKENDFERNGIPYGEWQLDSEYVELLNSAERLKGSDKRVEVIEEPAKDVTPAKEKTLEMENDLTHTDPEVKPEEIKVEPIIIPPVPGRSYDNPTPEPVRSEPSILALPPRREEEKKPEQPVNNNGLNSNSNKGELAKPESVIPALPPRREEEKDPEVKKETGLKVVAKKSWKWVKDHKKQILITLGLAAVTVSMIVVINQLIPAIMAAAKASQVSSLATSMLNNASLWHTASVGEQVALHGANTGLSSVISTLTGKGALFDAISGSWTVGGGTLGEFAIDAAAKASAAMAKVSSISSTALGFGIGGIGLTGIGAIISNKNRSSKYVEYKNQIKTIRDKIDVSTYDDILIGVLPDVAITTKGVEEDMELSNDERKILLAKLQKIGNRIALLEKKEKQKVEKAKKKQEEEQEEIRVDVNNNSETNEPINETVENIDENKPSMEINNEEVIENTEENTIKENSVDTKNNVKADDADNEWLSFFQRDNSNDAKTGEIIDLTGKVFVDMSSPNMNEEEQQTAKGRGGRR